MVFSHQKHVDVQAIEVIKGIVLLESSGWLKAFSCYALTGLK